MFKLLSAQQLNIRPQPATIGYIFREHDGSYYRDYANGYTEARDQAHVYSWARAEHLVSIHGAYGNWGRKAKGNWITVYSKDK